MECTPSVIMSLTGGDGMTIAEVSKKYDITSDTLRYYERIGLIPPVPRTKAVYGIMMKIHAHGLS